MTDPETIDELVLVMALNVLTACASANGDPAHPGLSTARSLAYALDRCDLWGRIDPRLRAEIQRLRAAAGPQMAPVDAAQKQGAA